MKIKVIGCGNAFSHKSFNQSFLLEEDGRTMLIDCGLQVPEALENAGVDFKKIDDIYISHLHSDHIGGLEYFAFSRYDWLNKPRNVQNDENSNAPTIIANKQLLEDLWNKSLRGGLESMEGFVSNINTFFKTFPVEPNFSFHWKGWDVSLIQQIHIMSGSVIMPSFGIMFRQHKHKTVYFVTDSQHCSPRQIEDFYKEADMIFQDSEFTGVNMRLGEGTEYFDFEGDIRVFEKDSMDWLTAVAAEVKMDKWKRFQFGSGVHANYAQLAGYPSANSIHLSDEIRSKMWLSHYQDFVLENKDMFGNVVDWKKEISNDGFAGIVELGQEFEV